MKGLFIVGTDTEIGKTVVSAILMAAAPEHTRYWKPFQTGYPTDCDTRTVHHLAQLNDERILNKGFRFELPASPHYAAAHEGSVISMLPLYELVEREENPKTTWVVEGVGGLMVPINETQSLPTFIKALGLPCLVVSSTKLGTINHTLLTLAQLKTLSIPTLGVLMVGKEDPSAITGINNHSDVPILGHIPALDAVTRESIADCVPTIEAIEPIMQALKGAS